MNTQVLVRRLSISTIVAVFASMFSAASAQAAVTGWLSPESGDGFYTQWLNSDGGTGGSIVNDGLGCAAGLTTFWTVNPDTLRASAIISIPGSVPDGSSIDSVEVQVCQSRGVLGTTGATFQTFVRMDSTNFDSGANITAAQPASNVTANTQIIPVGLVRLGATVLEAGTVKTNAIAGQRIYTVAARLTYTIPSSTTTVSCTTPAAINNTTSCTADVAPSAGTTVPTGAVVWSTTDAGSFSSESCTPGVASLSCTATYSPSGVGTPTVTAVFAGDANMTGSQGTADVAVIVPASATVVSCTSPIVLGGGTSSCTATVTPALGSSTPSGAVTWSTTDAGGFSAESCTPGVGSLACTATFTPGNVGTPTVTALFAGDANMLGSSGTNDVQVNAAPVPAKAVPVFGPIGLLLTMLGMGAIGAWRLRRRT